MRTHEVIKTLGITKKAIHYYEKQGLIHLERDANGYRDFDDHNLSTLKKIMLFRRAGISINDIKSLLEHSDDGIIKSNINHQNQQLREGMKKKALLERLVESEDYDLLLNESNLLDMSDGTFVLMKLEECLPDGFGKIIAGHFSCFEFDAVDSPDKNDAWLEMIKYLDEMESIEVPKELLEIYNQTDHQETLKIHQDLKVQVNEGISTEELKDYQAIKEEMDEILKEHKSEFLKTLHDFNTSLLELFKTTDYKTHVIENMKVLSADYARYHENLMKLSKETV